MVSKSSIVKLGFRSPKRPDQVSLHQREYISYQVPPIIDNQNVILVLKHSAI